MGIAENLSEIRERIRLACLRAGRRPDEVELCAVSKLHPASAIAEAYRAGQRLFGENYAQELRDKWTELSSLEGIRFHFIGRLQKNKAKYVAPAAETMESLDSLELASELDRRCAALGRQLSVLVEVNFDEAQKGGIPPADVPDFLRSLRNFPNLAADGLMVIPPAGISEEETRRIFRTLASLRRAAGLRRLSMGMSHDFEIAIEEGATIVRVGTAIFGPRPPRKPDAAASLL